MVFYGTLALGQPDSLKDGIKGKEIRTATAREISTFRNRRRTHLTKTVKGFCQACKHTPCECLY